MKHKPFRNIKSLNSFLRERAEFSLKAFGTPRQHNFRIVLKKLQDEIKELLDNPKDEGEWADCFLLLTDAAHRKGHSLQDLVRFSKAKLAINKKRKWKRKANGVYEHVK